MQKPVRNSKLEILTGFFRFLLMTCHALADQSPVKPCFR